MRFSAATFALTVVNSALVVQPVVSRRLREGVEDRVGSVVNAGTAWVGQLSTDHHHNKYQQSRNSKRNGGRTRLVNPDVDPNKSNRKECDPLSDSANLGVLSCGHEFFCAESTVSSLGGFCTNMENTPEYPLSQGSQRRRLKRNINRTKFPRDLQQDFTNDTLLYDFCGEGAGLDRTGCTCTNMDGLTLTITCLGEEDGGPECYTYTNKCDASVYACLRYHYVLEKQGTQNLRKRIYEQLQPYYERVVYTGIATKGSTEITSCQVEFNGVQCHSCQVVPKVVETEESTAPPIEWPCYQFDCSNTMGGHMGNSCDLEGTKAFGYVTYYGCPVCDVCQNKGVGTTMMTRAAVVDFSGTSYGCDKLDYMGSKALLNSAECAVVQSYAADLCGCAV